MKVSFKDKRLKALNKVPAHTPDAELKVAGLRPGDAAAIRVIVAQLLSGTNLQALGMANPSWGLHQWPPRKQTSPWSIDVSAQWRLLMEYDADAQKMSGIRLENPH